MRASPMTTINLSNGIIRGAMLATGLAGLAIVSLMVLTGRSRARARYVVGTRGKSEPSTAPIMHASAA